MIADDIFAGAGGWDLAAAELGIHARGVENMKEARATREAAGLTTIHDDVWTFQPDGNAAGLIASPPCQTFSAAGKGNGRKALDDVLRGIRDGYVDSLDHLRFLGLEVGDERTSLVLTPLHFALKGGYEWLAWEQVPTVLPVWEACAERLRVEGWNVWTGFLYSEMFGVPQTRKRAFLLASRRPVAPVAPTHSRYYSRTPAKLDGGSLPWVSMAEALGWGLTVTGGGTETGGAEPIAKLARYTSRADWLQSPSGITGPVVRSIDSPAATVTGADNYYTFSRDEWEGRNPERSLPDFLRMTTMPNSAVRRTDQPAPTIAFGHDAASAQWHWAEAASDKFTTPGSDADRAWPGQRPSPTIVGSFHPEIVAAPGYRTEVSRQNAPHSVRITVHEAGILQSFPANYPWAGAQGKQFLQAGNAVPPGMAIHALAAASGLAIEAEAVA